MIYKSKVGPFTFYQYSFYENKPKDSKKLFHSYRNFYEKQNMKNHIEMIQYNVRFDLEDLTREKLMNRLSSNMKKEIKRAINNGIKICEVNKNEFIEKYNYFANCKKINKISETIINNLSQNNNILIQKAMYGDINLAYKLTIYNSKKAIGVFGFSNRFEEKELNNLTGQGNRYLDLENIIYFSEKKLKYLDWGGAYINDKNPEKKRFTEYKLKFGGNVVEVYEYQSRAYNIAYKIKQKLENLSKGKVQYIWSIIRKNNS